MHLAIAALMLLPAAPDEKKDEVKMTDAGRKATARALAWLAKAQNADGSWSDSRYPHNTAITSFALLAFLSQGHVPDQGPYGKEVGKGMRFLLSCAREDGYLIGSRGGNMYCHGMATLALAELWGVSHDKALKPALTKAVAVIVGAQAREGGWRYSPRPSGSDISVTIMQVMALRAAKNAGIHVKDEVVKNALKYVHSCADRGGSGGFCYQPGSGPGFARTAAAACVLYLTGEYKEAKIDKAVKYMHDHFNTSGHFWYGHYYASHAMHQRGGDDWKKWYARLNKTFLPLQKENGSFGGQEEAGAVYRTAIAVIALSVPMNYLPIFQR
jgi:squalene cyclase